MENNPNKNTKAFCYKNPNYHDFRLPGSVCSECGFTRQEIQKEREEYENKYGRNAYWKSGWGRMIAIPALTFAYIFGYVYVTVIALCTVGGLLGSIVLLYQAFFTPVISWQDWLVNVAASVFIGSISLYLLSGFWEDLKLINLKKFLNKKP